MKSDSANKLVKITSVVEKIFGELFFWRIKNEGGAKWPSSPVLMGRTEV
jgi:hypothetical protein